ncbi:MAG: hypothetical protein NT154_01270 [Verrucomicrobia bacterium]|nr:hypothetical protein [Verrucomicrobiota bacterium]
MEEAPPLPKSSPAAPPPAMSLAARLLNVFAIPGEVFAVVKASRLSVGNWLVPALLSALVGVITAVVIVSQPAIQRQLREVTERQAKVMDEQVKAGKVKQTDVDRALAFTRAITAPATLKVLGSIAAGLIGFARVFWWAFVLWLLGRVFLKAQFGYLKALEVAGLGLMVSVLGTIVTLLLIVNLPKLFTTPSLALALSDFDASRKSPLLLGTANVFAFWLVGVFSVGLTKLAGVPFLRAAWFVFGCWLIQQSLLMLVAGVLGQFAL